MPDDNEDLTFDVNLNTENMQRDFANLDKLGLRFGRSISSAFAGAITSGRKFSDVLKSLALSLSRQALGSALKPLTSGLGQLFAQPFNLTANAKGNAFANGKITPFAKGGVLNSPALFPMDSGIGLAGERGAEAIMPLARGSDGSLGVKAQGGSAINITMNISTPDAGSFQASQSQIAASLSRAVGRGRRNL